MRILICVSGLAGLFAVVAFLSIPGAFGVSVLFGFLLVLYFLPSMTAEGRGHHQLLAILVLNLLLGWTMVGWIAALVWACTAPATRSVK
jgi:Superinfection immunity protein